MKIDHEALEHLICETRIQNYHDFHDSKSCARAALGQFAYRLLQYLKEQDPNFGSAEFESHTGFKFKEGK